MADEHLDAQLELALELLTSDLDKAAARLPAGVSRDRLEAFRGAQEWMRSVNIQGFGVGERVCEGCRTGEPALKVYVEDKLSRDRLAKPAPTELELPGLDARLRVDVEGIGRLRTHACRPIRRPALLGSSIGHVEGAAGTLGALVRKTSDPSKLHLLSAGHVLAPGGSASRDQAILQPAPEDCGRANHQVGTVVEHAPLMVGGGFPNLVDAAIARVDDPLAISPRLRDLGWRAQGIGAASKHDRLIGVGRTTSVMSGIVRNPKFHAHIDVYLGEGVVQMGFRDQILCTQMSSPGDSGALVFDEQQRAVGMLIAGNASHSIVTPIAAVFAALGIQLA